ncbi:hypothetical protein [Alloscardovia sp. HMSC034E08]|uniref:hypothetical protein n=1 Tax=Alloscardovia sp. HMSC034E08 TaxID=1739413 RepID=UPI001FEE13A7|nr:hypothetical protein [Alloscardovia sp. HMSC034E08]
MLNRKKKRGEKTENTVQEDVQPVVINLPSKKVKTTISNKDLTKQLFDRMFDDSLEDELRFTRDVLHKALISPDTPASALAAISRELINMTEKLNNLVEQSNDDPFNLSETEDVYDSGSFDSSLI